MLANYEKKLEEIKESMTKIGDGLVKANRLILDALEDCDESKFIEAKSHIKNVGNKTSDIDNNIITTLALHAPEARDLRGMVSYLKITNELLRASTNTRNFIKGFQNVCVEVDINTIKEYAIPMQRSTVEALRYAIKMINIECTDETREYFNEVLIAESKNDDLYDMVESNIFKQFQEAEEFDKYHKMLSALRKSEKIADRAVSIASLLLFAKVGGEIHQVS